VSSAASSFGRSRARGLLGRACLVVGLTAQALVLTSVAQGATAPRQAAPVVTNSDITVVQANLRSPQSAAKFQQDAAEVFAQDPDLITYNEVSFRGDGFLAPEGYALWRTEGHYTGHNPVAWRTDAWQEVAHGTWRISNYQKKPPGKTTLLGLRYANWVTLESVDGRRLSLVATHVAPAFRDGQGRMIDLLRPSVRRLSLLVEQLRGPVLVGGDFNVDYNSARYPRDLLDEARLKPTYDLMGGAHFPTGDHHGATIDYVFVQRKSQLQVDSQRKVELNSDHDAVVAGLSWTTDPPEPVSTTVRSRPNGTTEERLAVGRVLRGEIAHTAAGETVQVATKGLTLPLAVRALRRADVRGVRVQVTTLSTRLTGPERRLLGAFDTRGSWLRRCQGACRTQWQAEQPPSLLLVTGADGAGKVRVDVSRPLRRAVVNRRTTARISTSGSALEEARAAFAGL
jgi:endonuclease/exonuclease/phosphatase family metal-dependent hydrolase